MTDDATPDDARQMRLCLQIALNTSEVNAWFKGSHITIVCVIRTGVKHNRSRFIFQIEWASHRISCMTTELMLRRKWTLRAGDQQVVFIKKSNEHASHVLMKAFLWALYLPVYPQLTIELAIGDRYKPDVVALDDQGQPLFWGEAGQVSERKLHSLFRRYPQSHFAIAKWSSSLRPHVEIVQAAVQGLKRTAPVDLLSFPVDSAERFIDERGYIHVRHTDLEWLRLSLESEKS